MTTGYVVIGAGYGDEGKGLMTDYLVRKHGAKTVVRFNGGAQAGHTVETPDGKRHVFGHVGAGTFAGAGTILGPKFIINPLVLEKEAKALGADFIKPFAFAKAPISTIYDMILNVAVETARGNDRHGSCGLGINETVTRHATHPIGYGLSNRKMFATIRDEYVPKRLAELGHPSLAPNLQMLLDLDPSIHYAEFKRTLNEYMGGFLEEPQQSEGPVIFEGAQGLMLDEFLGEFPHVTRSMTGLPQAIEAAQFLGVTKLQPVYVTRCYKTRHGAGPLSNEGVHFSPGWKNTDRTNIDNRFQGSIRFAPLRTDELRNVIRSDVQRSISIAKAIGIDILKPELAVTCLDQVNGDLFILTNEERRIHFDSPDRGYIPQAIADYIGGVNLGYASFGPTHSHVVEAIDL